MKKKLLIYVMFTILIFFPFSDINLITKITVSQNKEIMIVEDEHNNIISRKIINNQIRIKNNSELASYSSSGTGTKADPYVIEGIYFSGFGGPFLEISNTTKHFLVQNNTFNGTDGVNNLIYFDSVINGILSNNTLIGGKTYYPTGIMLRNSSYNQINENKILNVGLGISHGYVDDLPIDYNWIFNNTIENSGNGIRIIGNNNTIESNSIFNCDVSGIHITGNNSLIISNLVDNCDEGIVLVGSYEYNEYHSNNRVERNSITGTDMYGIKLTGRTINNIIFNNTLEYNEGTGIYLIGKANSNTISKNYIFESAEVGISFYDSEENIVSENKFQRNYEFGITFPQNAWKNVVKYNLFYENNLDSSNLAGDRQALDNGFDNIVFANYWDDLFVEDQNNDGFIDEPYELSGTAGNVDYFPLVSPETSIPDSLVIPQKITVPSEGNSWTTQVIVEWDLAIDLLNPDWEFSYSLYTSTDDGNIWILLISGLSATDNNIGYYNWETSPSESNPNYLIKVTTTGPDGKTYEDVSDTTFIILNTYTEDQNGITSTPAGWNAFILLILFSILFYKRKRR